MFLSFFYCNGRVLFDEDCYFWIAITKQASIVDVGAADDQAVIIDYHKFGVNV